MKLFLYVATVVFASSCTFSSQQSHKPKTYNGMDFSSLVLPNQLEVLIVHDPRFQKSSAALAVTVGSMEDPLESQGLAHYLEHMLFLGTKDYPKSDEYSSYMQLNGGWDNAYTADDVTNYMFEVDHAAVEGGLQRFSRFFVDPLFDATFVEREKNAVNSEFEKNIKQDNWRHNHYMTLLTKPGHPNAKFSTGNTNTLKKVTRDDVIHFYKKFYSANNMKLVVMSAKPAEEVRGWVKKYFSDIPNFKAARPKYEDQYFVEGEKRRVNFIKTITDLEELTLHFNIPDDREYWASKPTMALARLLGGEGKGSLLSYLKTKGWAFGVNAGESAYRTFSVTVVLTPAGRKNYEDVVASVFSYISLMNEKQYPTYLFEEDKSMRRIALDNLEPSGSGQRAAWFAKAMLDYPVDEFLERNFLVSKYSPEDFKTFLSYLRADNCQIVVATRNEKTSKKESIFGIEYRREPYSATLTQKLDKPDTSSFTYPDKNKYIPNDFSLVMTKKIIGDPERTELGDRAVSYLQQDTSLGLAKGMLRLKFFGATERSPRNALLASLYYLAKTEELREWGYPITEASSNFSFYLDAPDEIAVVVTGYTQGLGQVMKDLIVDKENKRRIDEIHIDEKLFETIKHRYQRDMADLEHQTPPQRMFEEVSYISNPKTVRPEEYTQLIPQMKLKDVQAFAKAYFSKVSAEVVAYGNIKPTLISEVVDYYYSALDAKSLPIKQTHAADYRVVPANKEYSVLVKGKNNNHAMMAFYRLADWSVENHAKVLVLGQMLSQPYFNELRTNQQVGYIARADGFPSSGYAGLMAILQSPKIPSRQLQERSEKFLREFMEGKAKNLTEEDLKPVRSSLVNELLLTPNTLGERFGQFSNAALKYDGRFKIRQELAEQVKKVTVDDMKTFLQSKYLDHTPGKMVVYYSGTQGAVNKKDLPAPVIEKASDTQAWDMLNPYRPKAL